MKRNKHNAADAKAVYEAVRRPSMRFVPLKMPEQQTALIAHSVRDLLVRQRIMLVNALRSHLAELASRRASPEEFEYNPPRRPSLSR